MRSFIVIILSFLLTVTAVSAFRGFYFDIPVNKYAFRDDLYIDGNSSVTAPINELEVVTGGGLNSQNDLTLIIDSNNTDDNAELIFEVADSFFSIKESKQFRVKNGLRFDYLSGGNFLIINNKNSNDKYFFKNNTNGDFYLVPFYSNAEQTTKALKYSATGWQFGGDLVTGSGLEISKGLIVGASGSIFPQGWNRSIVYSNNTATKAAIGNDKIAFGYNAGGGVKGWQWLNFEDNPQESITLSSGGILNVPGDIFTTNLCIGSSCNQTWDAFTSSLPVIKPTMVGIFTSSCNSGAGWSRVTEFDNRFMLGDDQGGTNGGYRYARIGFGNNAAANDESGETSMGTVGGWGIQVGKVVSGTFQSSDEASASNGMSDSDNQTVTYSGGSTNIVEWFPYSYQVIFCQFNG